MPDVRLNAARLWPTLSDRRVVLYSPSLVLSFFISDLRNQIETKPGA